MSISVLGGVAKSHVLKIPSSQITRPTAVLLRRKLFDYKQNWQGEVFVDACAGSGAIGIEAWSRGADVFLVEINKKAFSVLKQNVSYLSSKFAKQAQDQLFSPSPQGFQKFWQKQEPVLRDRSVTVYIDPPYHKHELYGQLSRLVVESQVKDIEIWIESDIHKGPAFSDLNIEQFEFEQYKLVKQGTHLVGMYKRK